jgi:hypothetical protein
MTTLPLMKWPSRLIAKPMAASRWISAPSRNPSFRHSPCNTGYIQTRVDASRRQGNRALKEMERKTRTELAWTMPVVWKIAARRRRLLRPLRLPTSPRAHTEQKQLGGPDYASPVLGRNDHAYVPKSSRNLPRYLLWVYRCSYRFIHALADILARHFLGV